MKFKYGDEVKVISGFYKDLVGNVVKYNERKDSYDCILRALKGDLSNESPYATINADDLEKAV